MEILNINTAYKMLMLSCEILISNPREIGYRMAKAYNKKLINIFNSDIENCDEKISNELSRELLKLKYEMITTDGVYNENLSDAELKVISSKILYLCGLAKKDFNKKEEYKYQN